MLGLDSPAAPASYMDKIPDPPVVLVALVSPCASRSSCAITVSDAKLNAGEAERDSSLVR